MCSLSSSCQKPKDNPPEEAEREVLSAKGMGRPKAGQEKLGWAEFVPQCLQAPPPLLFCPAPGSPQGHRRVLLREALLGKPRGTGILQAFNRPRTSTRALSHLQ